MVDVTSLELASRHTARGQPRINVEPESHRNHPPLEQ